MFVLLKIYILSTLTKAGSIIAKYSEQSVWQTYLRGQYIYIYIYKPAVDKSKQESTSVIEKFKLSFFKWTIYYLNSHVFVVFSVPTLNKKSQVRGHGRNVHGMCSKILEREFSCFVK